MSTAGYGYTEKTDHVLPENRIESSNRYQPHGYQTPKRLESESNREPAIGYDKGAPEWMQYCSVSISTCYQPRMLGGRRPCYDHELGAPE